MGLLSFIKDAGEKLFGRGEAKAAQDAAAAQPSAENVKRANDAAGEAIMGYIKAVGLSATGLTVTFDGASHTATVYGVADSQEIKEKILLSAGNVEGVAQVNDMMTVSRAAPEARYYTVQRGDNLSKVAKEMYGNANKYPAIFEANKPMLQHPDKIYPGQVLRIPPL
ncbi:MAG: peptidoglycan-binding protein LysM [Betaproteobacteria bacterium]|nr:peptidoglycan-binding protein LysM [Betaproteobacteria bacterium]